MTSVSSTPADMGLGSWPKRRARITPGHIALRQAERTMTYSELAERSARLAGALARLGVGHGDRVAYLGVNDIAVFETLFAAGLLGAMFVPLNVRLSGSEIRYMLSDCGASVLVHSPDTDALVQASTPLPDTVRHVLALDPSSCPVGGINYQTQLLGTDPAPPADVSLDDPAVLLYTSGTTGRPKAAMLTHGNLTWNTFNQLAHTDILSTDRALCVAPLFHCTGLSQITLPTLFKGGSVEPVPRFEAAAVLALIGSSRVTSISLVPTMLKLMCEHPSWATTDVGSLTCVIYGGSPVQEWVAKAWLDRDVLLLQGYGMTEASPGVYMAVPDGAGEHPISVGVPHFFTDVAQLCNGHPVPAGPEAAELLARGPNIFTGYWARPTETESSFVGGDWFRTGDVLRVEDDGWAYVVDRVKDMIISGGENIYPAEVEARLGELAGVAGCAVVAVPDARWGEVGAAYVVLADGIGLGEADVRAHLESCLARYKVPKHIYFVDELPLTATGKVQRRELRERAAAVSESVGTDVTAEDSGSGLSLDLEAVDAIDVHVHVEQDAQGRLSLDDELMAASAAYFRSSEHRAPTLAHIARYYRARRTAAVVFTVDATTATGHRALSSEDLADEAAEHADILIPFGSVDPLQGRAALSRARSLVADHGVRGFKFHPSLQGFIPNEQAYYPLYQAIQEMGVPALFHTGQTGIGAGLGGGRGIKLRYSNPMLIDDVAADFPDLTIVLAHPSVPWQDEAISIATHKLNVYIDLSGWSPKYFPPQLVRAANGILREKVLFGSDFPVITPERWMRDFDALDIRPEVRPLLLKANAVRMLRLA